MKCQHERAVCTHARSVEDLEYIGNDTFRVVGEVVIEELRCEACSAEWDAATRLWGRPARR